MTRTRAESLAALRAAPHTVEPGQKWTVDRFTPADALGVARLYHTVYGDMFPIDHVYDPEELIRQNSGSDLHQVVARTPPGDIVGLAALFHNSPTRLLMEMGSLMVHPAYRGGELAHKLGEAVGDSLPRQLGLHMVYGQAVCDTMASQRIAQHLGTFPCALEVEAMPPRPAGRNDAPAGRVSLLDDFILLKDHPHPVHLPRRYSTLLRSIYATRRLSRDFPADGGHPGPTRAVIEPMPQAGLVRILVEEPGADFSDVLAATERQHPAAVVSQIVMNLGRPGCSQAVEEARAVGYWLGGLLPLWFDTDGFLLQKLIGRPDFSKIRLLTPEAQELLQTVSADSAAVSGQVHG
jgi:hypothetical protein